MMIRILALLVVTAMAGEAFASGGFGGGVRSTPRVVDPTYDQGKAIVKGRVRTYGKIKYCVSDPGADAGKKLGRKSVRPYKKASAQAFADSLYVCEMPEQRIVDILEPSDLFALVYYLNKRYKLNLT